MKCYEHHPRPETSKNMIICGDALAEIRKLPDESVHCCITSPPYYGLRDYGMVGQLGLESTPERYIARLVKVFREVWRVLRKDGTLWLNLGDSYATGAGKAGDCPGGGDQGKRWRDPTLGYRSDHSQDAKKTFGPHIQPNRMPLPGLKPKDLIGIPWRVAFALQADGWWLRQDIIWAKPNPMPESVTDRPTRSHEYIFLLAKNKKYYYDAEAVKEPGVYREDERSFGFAGGNRHGDERKIYKPFYKDARSYDGKHSDKQRGHGRRHAGFNDRWDRMSKTVQCSAMRNKRSVWTIATRPFTGAHFATFPPDLVEPMVKAGCSVGSTILDPFFGAGTVGLVAQKLGREWIGIDLNPDYCEMARERINGALFAEKEKNDDERL